MVLPPPPIQGVGNDAGFTMQIELRDGSFDLAKLQRATDEIVANAKTQSALLEAMEEHQVTAEGETRKLPEPFFVIATQNPSNQVGTYALPESQLDRFLMRISIGYPDRAAERVLLAGSDRRDMVDTLRWFNERHLEEHPGDSALEARIASYELAYRMQAEAIDVGEVARESMATQAAYGLHDANKDKVRKFLKATLEAIALLKNNKTVVFGTINKWYAISNREQQEMLFLKELFDARDDPAVIDGVVDFSASRRMRARQADFDVELDRLRHFLFPIVNADPRFDLQF